MLIGVGGAAGAGKDVVAKILVENHGFKRKALATKMKEAALALDPIVDLHVVNGVAQGIRLSDVIAIYGAEEAKKIPEVRRTYQRMGTEVGRDVIDPELWVKLVFRGMRTSTDLVLSDVRFLNEALAIHDRGGYVWRVIRSGAGLEGEAGEHISEKELGDGTDGIYHEIIDNDGTLEDLAKKVADILDSYSAGRGGLVFRD